MSSEGTGGDLRGPEGTATFGGDGEGTGGGVRRGRGERGSRGELRER